MEMGDVLLHFGELLGESLCRNALEKVQPKGDERALNFFWTFEIGQDTTHLAISSITTSDGASTTKTSSYSNIGNCRYKFGYYVSTASSRQTGQSILQMIPCPWFRSLNSNSARYSLSKYSLFLLK